MKDAITSSEILERIWRLSVKVKKPFCISNTNNETLEWIIISIGEHRYQIPLFDVGHLLDTYLYLEMALNKDAAIEAIRKTYL